MPEHGRGLGACGRGDEGLERGGDEAGRGEENREGRCSGCGSRGEVEVAEEGVKRGAEEGVERLDGDGSVAVV